MKDALGDVQSVLVLGGTSEIALATARKIAARRRARIVLAARKPEACDTGRGRAARPPGASAVDTVAFDATDFASHEGFVQVDVRPLRRLRPRARRVRGARRPGTRRARSRGRVRDRADELHRDRVGVGAARRAPAGPRARHARAALVGRRRARAALELRVRRRRRRASTATTRASRPPWPGAACT